MRKRLLLPAQRRLRFTLGLLERFIHTLVSEEDAIQSMGHGIIHLASVGTPESNASIGQESAGRDCLVIRILHQIGLIGMCAVGETRLHNFALIFFTSKIDRKRGSRIWIFGRSVNTNGIGKDDI